MVICNSHNDQLTLCEKFLKTELHICANHNLERKYICCLFRASSFYLTHESGQKIVLMTFYSQVYYQVSILGMHEQIRSYALMKISHKSNFSVAFSYVLQSFMSAYNFLELYIAV